jgi:hypothetical protein
VRRECMSCTVALSSLSTKQARLTCEADEVLPHIQRPCDLVCIVAGRPGLGRHIEGEERPVGGGAPPRQRRGIDGVSRSSQMVFNMARRCGLIS